MKDNRLRTTAVLLLAVVTVILAAAEFRSQHVVETLYPSAALSRTRQLSDYNPALAGTPGNTEVYVFEGREPGGSLLVLGGTHATEIAGTMTAVLLVESLAIRTGRVFVVPHANASAATHTRAREAHPAFIEIATVHGTRRFRYGSRYTNPVHQRPDPDQFRHPASPRILQGREARNLNRVYPGVPDGTLTEKVAWAIVELIRREKVDIAFDLHEAPPDRNLVNAIVASEPGQEIAAQATIMLQLSGWDFHLEASSPEFRGLSHREWTDATDTQPFLMETANPVQGRLRGRTTTLLAVTGRDDLYAAAARSGLLAMPYDSTGVALETRISRHLAGIAAILDIRNETAAARIEIGGWPAFSQLQNEGLGKYLGTDPAYRPGE